MTEIGKWVEIESGKYTLIEIDEYGNRSYTNKTLEIEEKEKGLVIGEIWDGSVAYNVKIVDAARDVFILEVKPKDLEVTENPLNSE